MKNDQIQNELENLYATPFPSFSRMNSLKIDLVVAFKEEESFWQQKSRDKWLLVGDKNSKFFHASVKGSRTMNGLEKLIDSNGVTQRSEASKGEVVMQYFRNLFSSSLSIFPQNLFSDFAPRVSQNINESLITEVTQEEVKADVFSIKPHSAPGAHGMTAIFYQQYWDVVGPLVTVEVLKFFQLGSFPSEWNFTQLCIIPKRSILL